MSSDTRLIIGMVVAVIVAMGVVVAVVLGTVLSSQILHNGTQVRDLATRIDDHRDVHASIHTAIQALRGELAARGDAGLVDEMRRDHRRLHDRMHNIENELSDVDQSIRRLRSDDAATQALNERLQSIQNELERMNRNLQNPHVAGARNASPE